MKLRWDVEAIQIEKMKLLRLSESCQAGLVSLRWKEAREEIVYLETCGRGSLTLQSYTVA